MKIRNKETGEIREISEKELEQYGLGGKLNKLGVKNSLWNNIRANKGSGRKPTKAMLAQEKKIDHILTKIAVRPGDQLQVTYSSTPVFRLAPSP